MKRIVIFQSDLRVGGIQKALVNILHQIDYTRCEVVLYLFDRRRFFQLPEHENLHVHYEKPYPFLNRLVYFPLLRRFAPRVNTGKEFDVAVDFNSYRNECAVNALTVPAKKRVMWIHNDVEIKRNNEPKYKVLFHFFRGKLKYYDEFAAVSPGIIDGFRRCTGLYDKPITAIPNQIDTEEIFAKAKAPVDFSADPACYNLCTMGRICHQKGFDILMDIFAEVRKTRHDMRLYLLGDGPDREKLEKQIASLGLDGAVTLLGNRENPFPYLAQMDGFVLTSRYEGQGLVLWEAKTLGLELFMSKHLEKYNPGLAGSDDLVSALRGAKRREKLRDDLRGYNAAITVSLRKVLELDGENA
jgi:glycosyltransferase involved in cell wall biosynthesis